MRHMSFFLTTKQIQARTKTVTRRMGWRNLKPGQTFWACRKCQGLRKGEKIERLAPLRCVSNEAVRLDTIDADDVAREGFPDMTPAEFVAMFCRHMKVTPETMIQRIEFEYLDVHRTAP